MKTTINVVSLANFSGGRLFRFLHKEFFNAILENEFVQKLPLPRTITFEDTNVTVQTKHTKLVFSNAQLADSKLSYDILYINHIPFECYTINHCCNIFTYEGFTEVKNLNNLEIHFSDEIEIMKLIPNFMDVVSYIKNTFQKVKCLNSLTVLQTILNILGVSLEEIELLHLSNFIEVKNGQVTFAKKIAGYYTIECSENYNSYTEKDFIFHLDSIFQASLEDGYSLTVFGCNNIRHANTKDMFNTATLEIRDYTKKIDEFNQQ